MEQALYELPEGWRSVRVEDVCNKVTDGAHHTPKYVLDGVPFLSVKDISKGKVDFSNTRFVNQETHNQLFKRCNPEYGDLLYTKVGTTGVAKVNDTKKEFSLFVSVALLKLKNDLIKPYFFEYMLNSPDAYEQAQSKTRGVANRNLVLRDIKNIVIPLPPLNEQKRIVAKLDALFTRIDTAISHLQKTLELSKALFASALDESFSPENNNGESVPLNQVATVARGKSKHRPRNDKTLFGGDYPFIQTGDVRNAEKYITAYSATYNEKGLSQSKLWSEGTICLTIAANIGEVAILGIDACFPDSVVGISSKSESNEYVYYFLTTLQRHLDSKATMAAQKNINLRVLSEIEIPLPSLDEQKRIVAHLNALSERTRALEAATQEKLNDLTSLKTSLLDAAFKGQL